MIHTAIVPITVHGKVVPDVVLSMEPQSSSTIWKWEIPRLGLSWNGHTRVDFTRNTDTEWWHKCDVDREIKDSIFKAVWK